MTFKIALRDGNEATFTKEGSTIVASCTCGGTLCKHLVKLASGQETEQIVTPDARSADFDLCEALPDSVQNLASDLLMAEEDFESARRDRDSLHRKLSRRLGIEDEAARGDAPSSPPPLIPPPAYTTPLTAPALPTKKKGVLAQIGRIILIGFAGFVVGIILIVVFFSKRAA